MLPITIVCLTAAIAVVALVLLWYWLKYIDVCVGNVFTTTYFTERGPIGVLIRALPAFSSVLFVGGLGLVVYWIGAKGILLIGSLLLFIIDVILIWLAVGPKADGKDERDVARFKANRPLLNWNVFGFLIPLAILSVVAFKMGLLPPGVNVWLYGFCLVEYMVFVTSMLFCECYDSEPSKMDWSKARTSVKYGVRNLVFTIISVFFVLLIAGGLAPTVNTYLHFVSGAEGEIVSWGMELLALVAALAVFALTIPFFPVWVPFYCWGFEIGLVIVMFEFPLACFLIIFFSRRVTKSERQEAAWAQALRRGSERSRIR